MPPAKFISFNDTLIQIKYIMHIIMLDSWEIVISTYDGKEFRKEYESEGECTQIFTELSVRLIGR